jgi:hypothetical protein
MNGPRYFRCVVYKLTGAWSWFPRELLRLDRLQSLILWQLGLGDADATAIAKHLGQLTSAIEQTERQPQCLACAR